MRLLPIFLLAGCQVLQTVSTPIGPTPERIERRLVLGDPGTPQVILEADWHMDAGRYCVSGGDVDLITPLTPLRFQEATICVTVQPPALSGDARLPFPALGFLSALVPSGVTPMARLSLTRGGPLELGGERIAVDPTHFYLTADYASRYDVALGSGKLGTSRLILDPHEPVIYVGGDMSGLFGGTLTNVAIGFAPNGNLAYASAIELYDGSSTAFRKITGHLFFQGTMPLGGDLPITVTGRFVCDLDADDDGQTVLGGDAGDFTLGGDVKLRVGYGDFGLDLAGASLMYAAGVVYFGGTLPAAALGGTRLSAFQPGGDLTVQGVYRSAKDFALLLRGDGRMLGFPITHVEIALGTGGIRLSGRADLGPVGPVDLAGAWNANGSYSLRGKTDLTAAGLPITGAEIALAPSGVEVSGTARFAGVPFKVIGKLQAGGALSLIGVVPVKVSGVTGKVTLTLDARPRANFQGRVCAGPACIDLPETELDPQGNVCPSFAVVGRKCVKVL